MSEAPLMVGVSGLRGIVGKSLTPEVATRFAAAFGGWLGDRATPGHRPKVVIGRDGRAGGQAIHDAAIAGLMNAGCLVVDLGVAMTPTVGVMTDREDATGGMVVTASHNPQEWNGLKCLVREGDDTVAACAPNATSAAEIIARFRGPEIPPRGGGSVTRESDPAATHIARVWEQVETLIGPPIAAGIRARVAIDSVNASGAPGAAELLRLLGCMDTVHIGNADSGMFPHPPEPLRENLGTLCSVVRQQKATIGFAQDPDADRLAIVDERGDYIGEEYTLVLAAEAILGSHKDMKAPGRPRPVLVTNLSTSRMIDDVAARHGARVVRTAVGEANVVDAMKQEEAAGAYIALGGEGNGGVILPTVTYVRDSLSAMALVLVLLARTGKTVSGLVASMPRYAIEKRKVDLARKEDAAPAVQKIAAHWKAHRVDLQDGVRIDFATGPLAGKAWIHVRASNTEPIMRLIAEAPEPGQAKAILDEAARVIG